MVTALLVVLVVLLVAGLVGMFWQMCNGSGFAWFWWVTGGAGQLVEIIGKCLAEIADANR